MTGKRLNDLPAGVIVEWADAIDWPAVLPKRAWAKFTDWHFERTGLFGECTGGGGFSGAAKLQAAYHYLRRRLERDGYDGMIAWVSGHTIGDCLAAARENAEPLGFLPPVEHASRMARMAGRPDIAERLADL